MQSLKAYSKRSTLIDQYLTFSAYLQASHRNHKLLIAAMNLWEKMIISLIIFFSVTSTDTDNSKLPWIFSLASSLPV